MKHFRRILAALMALTFAGLCACSGASPAATTAPGQSTETNGADKPAYNFTVDAPYGEMPVYAFDHEPTVAEMRAAAVALMRYALTVQWYTPEAFSVSTTVSQTKFDKDTRYAGIPYTGPNTSLYAFLEFLDPASGRLLTEELNPNGGKLGQNFQSRLGSSCSGTAGWAIASVCNSVHGKFQAYYMVAQNGWLPLGDYTYDLTTPSFGTTDSKESTDKILERYGREKMYQCYALLQPGDILVWQNTEKLGHTMMATENAVVVKNADGTINGDESYVIIQDQRSGGFDQTDEDSGNVYHGQGRIDCKYTFSELFEKKKEGYIPMTTAEFQGQKPYDTPAVSLTGDAVSKSADLKNAVVTSNYPMATLSLYAQNKDGGEKDRLSIHLFTRDEIDRGVATAYDLSSLASSLSHNSKLISGSTRITVEVRLANGQVFTPVDFFYSE